MRIVVTPRDILQARLALAEGHERWLVCPVAQSLKRRGFRFVSVDQHAIKWRHDGQFRRAVTPTRAVEFIWDFDHDMWPEPFSFEFGETP